MQLNLRAKLHLTERQLYLLLLVLLPLLLLLLLLILPLITLHFPLLLAHRLSLPHLHRLPHLLIADVNNPSPC